MYEKIYCVVTPIETRVLNLLAKGYTVEEIGQHLSLSPSTVHKYISLVLISLGARNKTEAVAIAVSAGVIKRHDPWLPPEVDSSFSETPSLPSGVEDLTRREMQIWKLFGDYPDITDEEIAGKLSIAPCTVRCHLQKIYEKLGVGRGGAIGMAVLAKHGQWGSL